MGRFALAVCVAWLVSGNAATSQENVVRPSARQTHIQMTPSGRSIDRPSGREAMNERVTRAALRVALASNEQLSPQDLVGLLVLCAAARQGKANLGH